jgi:hypothetical protein
LQDEAGDEIASASHRVPVPGRGVLNGDFELGFDAGVARGWQIQGEAFAYDSKNKEINIRHSGDHAQTLVANGGKAQHIESLLIGKGLAEKGKAYVCRLTTCSVVHAGTAGWTWRRLGVDPTGGDDPEGDEVIWSRKTREPMKWVETSLEFTAASPLVTVFIEADTASPILPAEYWLYIDDVRLEETP